MPKPNIPLRRNPRLHSSAGLKTTEGLDRTLQVLSKTNNEAAVGALVPGLDSTYTRIQHGALRALIERRGATGLREILKRLHTAGPSWREIIQAQRGRMIHTLRDGVLGPDQQICVNACQAVLWLREYDLVPALLTALEADVRPHVEMAAQTLLALVDLLCEELASGPSDDRGRHELQPVRQRVIAELEASVGRFPQHERGEVVRALVVLAPPDSPALRDVLHDPLNRIFRSLADALLEDGRAGVMEFLLSFLDDPQAPPTAISLIARRADVPFLKALLRKLDRGASPVVRKNLKRIESLASLEMGPVEMDRLDEVSQRGIAQWIVATAMPRGETFRIIERLAIRGKPSARAMAVKQLANFTDTAADALLAKSLTDHEPRVQAAAVAQLRQRFGEKALVKLFGLVASPHECVRKAACESLCEFSFARYVAAFDLLDDETQFTVGRLVRRLHPESISALAEQLRGGARVERLRALTIAGAMGALPNLQGTLIEALGDEDYLMRSEAARALGACNTAMARHALHRALCDRSNSVQVAAEQSLELLESLEQDRFPALSGSTA